MFFKKNSGDPFHPNPMGWNGQSCLAEANLAEGIDKTITKSVNISLVDNLKMV